MAMAKHILHQIRYIVINGASFFRGVRRSLHICGDGAAAEAIYFYRCFFVLFFNYRRDEVLNGVSQLWVMDDKMNDRSFSFGHHSPLAFVNENLQIAESVR